MTAFVPGAGPPPTRIPIRFIATGPLRRSRDWPLEARAQTIAAEVGGLRQPLHPDGVTEVFRFQPEHVLPGHPIAVAPDVHVAYVRAPRSRSHVLEPNRHQPSVLDGHHGSAAALGEKADRAVSEVAAVGRVECDGVGAAE